MSEPNEELIDDLSIEDIEAEAGADDSDKGEQDDGKTVPLAALHEARSQNRQLREELARRDSRMDRLQQAIDAMEKKQDAPPPEPEIEIPDFAEDPQGNINARFQRLERLLEKNATETSQTSQAAQQQQVMAQLDQAIARDRETFESDHKDYAAALSHGRRVRMQEFAALGYNDAQVRDAVINEERIAAATALQQGKSPSEFLYNRAKIWGFAPGKADAGVDGKDVKPDLEDAESMGGGGGHSVREMLEADDDEFDAMFQEMGYGKRMN